MTNHAAPATAGRLPRMASTSVKFHVEHRNSEWPMALVGRRVCLKHIARTTSFTWNTRRRRGRWNGPADRIPIARTQPVGPFTPCICEVMPKEPGVVSDRLLRPVAPMAASGDFTKRIGRNSIALSQRRTLGGNAWNSGGAGIT